MEVKPLAKRSALVTGAASGIGLATARLLSERGYAVVAGDVNFERMRDALEGVADVLPVRLDVKDLGQVQDAVRTAEDTFGGLNVVAHVAGLEVDAPLEQIEEKTWDLVVDTNLKGTFFVCSAAAPALRRAGGGAMVTVSSMLARVALPGVGAYSASKGGVEAMTRAFALDLAGDGIRVNTVLPGPTDTPLMWAPIAADDISAVRAQVEREVPLGRVSDPREIATVIAFLLSDDASFMTGSSVVVDGGALARSSISA